MIFEIVLRIKIPILFVTMITLVSCGQPFSDDKKNVSEEYSYGLYENISNARILTKPITSSMVRGNKHDRTYSHFAYIQFAGLPNLDLQESINKRIENSIVEVEKIYEGYLIEGSTIVSFFNNYLLVLKSEGYQKINLKSERMKFTSSYHINLKNGKNYTLRDLFKRDDYEKSIKNLMKRKHSEHIIRNDMSFRSDFTFEQFDKNWGNEFKGFDNVSNARKEPFIMSEEYLYLYTLKNESDDFFIGYRLEYKEVENLIDKNGELWNTFKKGKGINMIVEDRDY